MLRFQDPVTTVDQLLALPDDGLRHELLDGEHVVTPAPAYRHEPLLEIPVRDLFADLPEPGDQ
jgi:hypothetical protein